MNEMVVMRLTEEDVNTLLKELGYDENIEYHVPKTIEEANKASIEAFIRNQKEKEDGR